MWPHPPIRRASLSSRKKSREIGLQRSDSWALGHIPIDKRHPGSRFEADHESSATNEITDASFIRNHIRTILQCRPPRFYFFWRSLRLDTCNRPKRMIYRAGTLTCNGDARPDPNTAKLPRLLTGEHDSWMSSGSCIGPAGFASSEYAVLDSPSQVDRYHCFFCHLPPGDWNTTEPSSCGAVMLCARETKLAPNVNTDNSFHGRHEVLTVTAIRGMLFKYCTGRCRSLELWMGSIAERLETSACDMLSAASLKVLGIACALSHFCA